MGSMQITKLYRVTETIERTIGVRTSDADSALAEFNKGEYNAEKKKVTIEVWVEDS